MGLPHPLPPGSPGSGHGPFGVKAFHGALIGCGLAVVLGLLMVLYGGEAVRSVGTSLMVVGILGLVTGAVGLLIERHLQRRRPPPPALYRQNGRGPHPPRPDNVKRRFDARP